MLINKLDSLPKHYKNFIVFFYDAFFAFVSYPLALAIRFGDFNYEHYYVPHLTNVVLLLFGIKLISFYLMKLHRGVWRFSSTADLMLIGKTVSLALLVSFLVLFLVTRLDGIPRSSFIIDWFLLMMALGGGRFGYRIWRDGHFNSQSKRIIIVGPDSAADQLIRELKRNDSKEDGRAKVVAIIDEDKKKHLRTIAGVPVVGGIQKLKDTILKKDADQVLVAIPNSSSQIMREIVNQCTETNVSVKTLPSLRELVGGKIDLTQLRKINEEDLLGRRPINLDLVRMGEMITGKIVLITGAGGSIGSELSKQILKFQPKELLILDICELFLYKLEMSLKEEFPEQKIVPLMADVGDSYRIRQIVRDYNPQILYHAAAYKHVPMMEENPREAIRTNVLGTLSLVNEMVKSNLEAFVMISTDKAVNPTSVMGSTKRIAEMICQSKQHDSLMHQKKTRFMIVRFGNVLGSTGSVIPRFKEQIKKGGPVTVTHPEMTRYFMSIPEATQLVIQAGSIGKGGEIFVLNMGEPVKIVDLAKDLIGLSGLTPGKDIEIVFTGTRQGEKLYEELLFKEEETLSTAHDLVRMAKTRPLVKDFDKSLMAFHRMVNSHEKYESMDWKTMIKGLVPEYQRPPKSDEENLEETSSVIEH